MQLYRLIARLLDYPDAELFKHLSVMKESLESDPSIPEQERKTIVDFLTWMGMHTLIGLQETYVQTFDMTPEHDLHLTHHLFGDDRGRGPALVDLGEHYRSAGLELEDGELPDYLPLILEYVSTLDEMEARIFLGDARKVLTVLAENLEKAGSPYSRLIRIIESRGHLARAA